MAQTPARAEPPVGRLVAVIVPALVTLVVGLTHPVALTASSVEWWRDLHLILLPVFPLIGAAPWIAARDASPVWRRLAAVGGYLFAVFYTALDVLAGIAAGAEQLAGHPEAEHTLFAIAAVTGPIGAAGLALGWAAATIGVVRRAGPIALLGLAGVAGAALVWKSHIYAPVGTTGLVLLLVAGVGVVLAGRRARGR